MWDVLAILIIPYMTIVSRMNGGKWPIDLPWGLDAFALALPYLLFWPVLGWWTLLGCAGAVVGIRSGHGRGFHYDRPFKEGSEPEKVEILIPSRIPVWGRKALIMGLTGLAVTLAVSLCMAFHGFYLAALVLALSGLLKSVAYLAPRTETSEYLRGGFLGLGIVIAILIL